MWKFGNLRRSFDALISRARFERDLRDELRQHLEDRTRDLIDAGVAPDEATRQARVEFGAVERYKEQCRDARGFASFRPFHGLGGDIRLAIRRLAATPQFLVFAALSLAVGVGVTTAAYSILYSLVWKPIPIAEPAGAVFVAAPGRGGQPLMPALLTGADFDDLQRAPRTMSTVAAMRRTAQPLAGLSTTEFADIEAVSGEYFRVTGITPHRGRTITPEDDAGAAPVLVLSDRAWHARFDADPNVVGRVVRLAERSFEVIGIAAPGFDGIQRPPIRAAGWVPLSTASAFSGWPRPAAGAPEPPQLTVIARLAPGRTVAHAAAELSTLARRLDDTRPLRIADGTVRNGVAGYISKRPWSARTVNDTGTGAESRVAALVVVLVALVLGVACTNLANLMLARGAQRQQEFAVRRALGASRWRLVRELTVEGGMVALLGGACAVGLLTALLRLAAIDIPLPRGVITLDPEVNLPALAVATLALGLSMLVFGLEPAMQLTRGNVVADFAGGAAAVGVPRARRQRAFIRWQVAVSASFFLVAAILVNVILLESRGDTGVDVDRLGIATVHFGMQGWDEPRARRALQRVAEELRGAPGIDSVAFSTGAPFGMNMTPWASITTPDKPFIAGARSESAYAVMATPELFRTLGLSVVRGRPFDARDDATAPRVMVVSELTARTMFGTSDALGRQLLVRVWGRPGQTYNVLSVPSGSADLQQSTDRAYTIVGIARDTDTGEAASRRDTVIYLPLAQQFERNIAIFARTPGDGWNAARAIQLAVRRVDPDLGIGTAGPASMIMAGEFLAARVAASFATGLGLMTLLMSMVGLYGVQSHIVARRTREIGLRIAIGASATQVRRMVLGEGYRPVLQGIGLGLFLGVFIRLLLRATVNRNIDPFDPLAFAIVPIPLIAAAFVACYLPARRASRVDPNEALRHL